MPLVLIPETQVRAFNHGVCTVQTPPHGTAASLDLRGNQRGLYGTIPLLGITIPCVFGRPNKSPPLYPVPRASAKERVHGQ